MEQNSRLKPATKHVIRCAAALACPKMAPTFLIGQTLNNVSALSTALPRMAQKRHLLDQCDNSPDGRQEPVKPELSYTSYGGAAPFLYDVASHVKNCHSGHYYYLPLRIYI